MALPDVLIALARVQRLHRDTDKEALGIVRGTVRGRFGLGAGRGAGPSYDEWPDLSQS
jgi:hypothetical protein